MPTDPKIWSLGLGHVLVSRSHDHVGGRNAFRPVAQGGHRLHTAEAENFVGAGRHHGVERGGIDPALAIVDAHRAWRRAGDDAPHPGHLAVVTLISAEATSGYRPPGT
jgi:hypothetical protein